MFQIQISDAEIKWNTLIKRTRLVVDVIYKQCCFINNMLHQLHQDIISLNLHMLSTVKWLGHQFWLVPISFISSRKYWPEYQETLLAQYGCHSFVGHCLLCWLSLPMTSRGVGRQKRRILGVVCYKLFKIKVNILQLQCATILNKNLVRLHGKNQVPRNCC